MTGLALPDVPRGGRDVLRLRPGAAGLPTEDLNCPDRLVFGLSDEQGPLGYVELEGNGRDRLLRSLVVMSRHRSHGHGRELVRRLEHVGDGPVDRLHLLATGAVPFLRDLGSVRAERAAAPPAIASTSRFTSLCPASAVDLVKEPA